MADGNKTESNASHNTMNMIDRVIKTCLFSPPTYRWLVCIQATHDETGKELNYSHSMINKPYSILIIM